MSVQVQPNAFFRPRRLTHVNILVSELDRSMDFYKTIAGFEEVYRVPARMTGFVSNGNTHHDIGMTDVKSPIAIRRTPGLNHLAFELETEADLVEGYKRAIEAGITFVRTADHDVAHSVYGVDPDGNEYEIYADVVRNWREVRRGIITKPKPKWVPGQNPPSTERNYHLDPEIRRVDGAVFHPRRTTHAALVVENLGKSVAYYRDVVGLTVLVGGEESRFAVLGGSCGEPSLSLFRASPARPVGLHHVGFEVWDEEDLDQGLVRMKGTGLEPVLHVDHPVRRCVLLRDPNGVLLQFYVNRDKSFQWMANTAEEIALLLA